MSEETTIHANPFYSWAELTRELRERFVSETGMNPEQVRLRTRAVELLNAINTLTRTCQAAAEMLDQLEEHEPDAFLAFHRTLGAS